MVCWCVLYFDRLCSLTLTHLILLKPLETELQSVIVAVKMQVCVKHVSVFCINMLVTGLYVTQFVVAADVGDCGWPDIRHKPVSLMSVFLYC